MNSAIVEHNPHYVPHYFLFGFPFQGKNFKPNVRLQLTAARTEGVFSLLKRRNCFYQCTANFLNDFIFQMLKQLYEQDYPRLKRLAYSMAGNEWEDILQDSFMKMIPYQHLSYAEAQALITTIVKNKCLDWIRHEKTVKKYRQNMPEPEAVTPPSYSWDAKDLRTHVNRLPPYTRLVIELRFFEDMTLRDIGAIVNKDHATVYSQIRAGLRKLKPVV